MVYKWAKGLQALIYPPTCLLCGDAGREGLDLCPGCLDDLPRIRRPCRRCGLPLAGAEEEALVCGVCQRTPPPFDACRAALQYAPPVDGLVARFKFQRDLAAGRVLGELLLRHLDGRQPLPGAIVPVPLHSGRLRERGYNQALELARVLAPRLGIPIAFDACRRSRSTRRQAELPQCDRRRNVRHAFQARRPAPAPHVAVVDDVVTTASTVAEVARVLRRAGARQVEVWAAARRP